MKATVCIAAATCLVFAASAQETQQEHGRRVVNDALKALGGAAFLHMEDRVESGHAYSFYNKQLSGLQIATLYWRYLAPVPGKVELRYREAYGLKKDEGGRLITEDKGWEYNYHGARPLPDDTIDTFRDSMLHNIFYILRMRLDEPGLTCYFMGTDRFESQPVNIVDITDAGNRTVTVYFSQLDKLPIRQSFKRRNETYHDFDTEVSLFAKYRDVGGGIMWPYDVRRERNGQKIFEMYSDNVEVNKNLTDDIFTLPAKLKILPPGK
jgi:hypothetical protein